MWANALTSLTVMILWQRTIDRDVIASIGETTPTSVILESQAVSAVIMSQTAGRNFNAGILLSAPALSNIAEALKSSTVVVVRTLSRNVVAGIRDLAEASTSLEGQTVTTIVVSFTAIWDSNACIILSAPSKSTPANAFSSFAVVVKRTLLRNGVAGISLRAPSSSGHKRSASTAVIMSLAACRNVNTCLRTVAPTLVWRANTPSGLTVVAFRLWAINREIVASIRQIAESGSGYECQTVATVIMSLTTEWNSDTPSLSVAPRESIFT